MPTPSILKLRKGTDSQLSSITLVQTELYYNTDLNTIIVGKDGIGNNITLSKLNESNSGSIIFTGAVSASNMVITDASTIPASVSGSGTQGTIKFDGDYIYLCVSNDTWVRAPVASW